MDAVESTDPAHPASAQQWAQLRTLALEQTQRSYAPYSDFQVGAAALTTSGSIVTGCNVENASYGLTLCAECGLVSNMHSQGAGQLTAIVVVSGSGEDCTPCGRCRQLLIEQSTSHALIETADGPVPVADLLPSGFTATRIAGG